jgi:hypothetical protein
MAGWRVLADLVRAGGLMMIGLYSEIARWPVVEARRLIAARGYPVTLAGIRRFRADLRAADDPVLRGHSNRASTSTARVAAATCCSTCRSIASQCR